MTETDNNIANRLPLWDRTPQYPLCSTLIRPYLLTPTLTFLPHTLISLANVFEQYTEALVIARLRFTKNTNDCLSSLILVIERIIPSPNVSHAKVPSSFLAALQEPNICSFTIHRAESENIIDHKKIAFTKLQYRQCIDHAIQRIYTDSTFDIDTLSLCSTVNSNFQHSSQVHLDNSTTPSLLSFLHLSAVALPSPLSSSIQLYAEAFLPSVHLKFTSINPLEHAHLSLAFLLTLSIHTESSSSSLEETKNIRDPDATNTETESAGWLTMDSPQCLRFLSYNEVRTETPVVGVWFHCNDNKVSMIQAASALRYLFSPKIKTRLGVAPLTFLCVRVVNATSYTVTECVATVQNDSLAHFFYRSQCFISKHSPDTTPITVTPSPLIDSTADQVFRDELQELSFENDEELNNIEETSAMNNSSSCHETSFPSLFVEANDDDPLASLSGPSTPVQETARSLRSPSPLPECPPSPLPITSSSAIIDKDRGSPKMFSDHNHTSDNKESTVDFKDNISDSIFVPLNDLDRALLSLHTAVSMIPKSLHGIAAASIQSFTQHLQQLNEFTPIRNHNRQYSLFPSPIPQDSRREYPSHLLESDSLAKFDFPTPKQEMKVESQSSIDSVPEFSLPQTDVKEPDDGEYQEVVSQISSKDIVTPITKRPQRTETENQLAQKHISSQSSPVSYPYKHSRFIESDDDDDDSPIDSLFQFRMNPSLTKYDNTPTSARSIASTTVNTSLSTFLSSSDFVSSDSESDSEDFRLYQKYSKDAPVRHPAKILSSNVQ